MLSQESAVGQYPVEAIAMMATIAERTEPIAPYREWNERRVRRDRRDPAYTIAYTACARRRARPGRARLPDAVRPLGAADLRAPPDGADLRALARPRDRAPLRADVGRAGRLDAPLRGTEELIAAAAARVVELGWCKPGDRVGDHRRPALGRPGTTSLLQITEV